MFKKVIVPFRPYYLGTFYGNSFPSVAVDMQNEKTQDVKWIS